MKILGMDGPRMDHNFRQWWHFRTDDHNVPRIFTNDSLKASAAERAFKCNLDVDVRENFGYIRSIVFSEKPND